MSLQSRAVFGSSHRSTLTGLVMALSGDGRRAYLTNPEDHSATIVDIEEARVVATLKTGKRPDGIAWALKPR